MYCTFGAHGLIMSKLRSVADAYRAGVCGRPTGVLAMARKAIAGLGADADRRREDLRSAGPPGPGTERPARRYRGRICRDVAREGVEKYRADARMRGEDPIFPSPPRVDDYVGRDCDSEDVSAAGMLEDVRSRTGIY